MSDNSNLDMQVAAALVPLLRAVRAHRRIVVAITAAAVLACGAFLLQRTPAYEAHAEIVVTPLTEGETAFVGLPIIRTSPGDPTRTVMTAATLIDSSATASAAAKELPGKNITDVRNTVTVEPREGTNVIEITARDASPEGAAAVASAYARGAIETQRKILRPAVRQKIKLVQDQLDSLDPAGSAEVDADLRSQLSQLRSIRDGTDPTMSVSSLAEAPGTATGKPGWLLLLVAVGGGALIGAGAALLLSIFSPRRIEDAADLLTAFPLPIFARMPAQNRRRPLSRHQAANVRSGVRLLMARLRLMAGDVQGAGPDQRQDHAPLVVLIAAGPAATTAISSLELPGLIAEIGETTVLSADSTQAAVAELRDSASEIFVVSNSPGDLPLLLELAPDVDRFVVIVRCRETTIAELGVVTEALKQTGGTDRAGYLVLGDINPYATGEDSGGWLVHAEGRDPGGPDRAQPESAPVGEPGPFER